MSYFNSQEQAIYRSLAGRIQMGFYENGERFPPVQEIAGWYGVSYCPAQRAIKALESKGLIRLTRGKETQVLARPYESYLDSEVFASRAGALWDLAGSLALISPEINLQGMRHMAAAPGDERNPGKYLYQLFAHGLRALGNRTLLGLYYDVDAFIESAFLDIYYRQYGREEADRLLRREAEAAARCLEDCQGRRYARAAQELSALSARFFQALEQYLRGAAGGVAEPFVWSPQKGRARYCDLVAIDLVSRINQGVYPVGSYLPRGERLADLYHVSPITIRRSVNLLNRLGVVKTVNGVGSRVIFPGDASTPHRLKDLMLDGNMTGFLEALQLIALTGEAVLGDAFPHMTAEARGAIAQAAGLEGEQEALEGCISACMQAVVRCSPHMAIREIYEKLTLLLLKGSVLKLGENRELGTVGCRRWVLELAGALNAGDGPAAARAFRRMMEESFLQIRRYLIRIGVAGAEKVALLGLE